MDAVEPFIFQKLKVYKQVANRERFILPEDKDISFFIKEIDNCINFLS